MKRLLVVFIVSSVLISASLILPLASYNLAKAASCVEPMVSAGNNHTVGLKADGTLIATGYNHYDQCNISSWTDIIQVVAGASYTIGLKSNGSVNAIGFNGYGQCNVSSWTGIVQVASGGFHTVGLKSDGTVVAVGDNNYGQCNVSSWTNISQVAAGYRNTAGLKSDGTVVVVGDNYYGQCNVSSWTNISQVTIGGYGHIVGLRSNGSVIAMGDDYYGQCNVGNWSGIVQVAAGDGHTLGVRSNGSVVAIGCNDFGQCNVGTWTDIVQVTAEYGVSIGLRVAGSVVAVGDNTYGQCDVGAWNLAPQKPDNTLPANGVIIANLSPTFQWSAVNGAESYNFQLSTEESFNTTALDIIGINSTSYALITPLNQSRTYYWHVKAVSCNGVSSNWSDSWQFMTDGPVTFPDPGLDAAVRTAINKSTGDIYQSDLDGLTYLNAQEMNISDLTGIEHCANLNELNMNLNHINDISALSGLDQLTALQLCSNQIGNVTPLSGLTNLQDLRIFDNQIEDVSSLSGLTTLLVLILSENRIADFSSLSGLNNMWLLDLDRNNISTIPAISGFAGLTDLSLFGNQIIDISALSALPNLHSISLDYNQVSDISSLSGMASLQYLSMRGNNVSDITPLAGHVNLEYLTLDDNQVTDISIVPGLTDLIRLHLCSNQISSIPSLAPLTNLEGLCLSENQITDISGLSGLTSIEEIDLQDNQIADLGPLSELYTLEALWLRNNQISDIQPLVDNLGLASGDNVFLRSNPLGVAAYTSGIPALQSRGVYVEYTAPSEVWVDDDFYGLTPGWGINHFNKIQDGIDAVSGSTVHVAEGIYYENIVLKDGVELLGAGSDTTIIDGMQAGSVIFANNLGNTTKVDSFTVTNGSNDDGGGMYNYNASPIITNCIFQNNMGTFYGGGMYNNNSSPVITNCIFQNNTGTPGSALRGGGMYNMNSASSSITNCIFDSNTAYFGSGIQNYNSSPTITDCIFQNNWAATEGGGMCNENSTPVMTDCIFQNNQAIFGAGVHNRKSSPIITGCIFQNNRVRDDLPSLYNGGGMYNYDSSPIITNSVFWHNSNYYGGGMYNHDSSPIITNSVFWYNSATFGAAIYNDDSSPAVTYCNIQGGYTGEGNINSAPLFVNASAGDFHLSAGSPCIDAGNNSAPSLPSLDYEGDPRILPIWGTVDMGADEYIHPAPTCDSWDVQYRIVGGQITMNYSAAGITPVKKIVPLSEEHGGYMTFKFCKEANNGGRLVVIPQDGWYMESITVENVMTGIDMNLSIRLDSDASGILYVDDSIGDVDVSSESVSGRTPVQIDTIGDGTMDVAGSMLIPMTLVGDFNTSVGQSGELPFGMIFTTENTSNVASIPENSKMDGATMTSEGVPFAEEGGVASYAGTNGTITATGTGDCLGIRLVGIRIDFQFEMKLELEPVRTADVNCDGSINVLDMIRIGQHWGQTGSESWLPEDVNSDGTINVLDMIVIGQNWTG